MARKRTQSDAVVQERIVALMRAGGTAESISTQLAAENVNLSRATIGRRMRELSGRVKKERADALAASKPNPKAPLPASPEEIPEDADLETLNEWLDTAKRMGRVAELDGDLESLARAGRLAASLLDAKRKATPPTKADPNDHPDMVKLGAEVAERMHAIIKQVSG